MELIPSITFSFVKLSSFRSPSVTFNKLTEFCPAIFAALKYSQDSIGLTVKPIYKDIIQLVVQYNLSKPEDTRYKSLLELDPVRTNRLHPNDKRKILRSLEILRKKGRKHSDILQEQQNSEGGSLFGGGLRFSNALIFWVMCEQTILDSRLDERVDQMLKEGLVEELLEFHKKYNEEHVQEVVDYTKGVFQSIGFKEFHKYLMLTLPEKETVEGKKIFEMATENLKRATRRYAKKQKRWIVNRFLSKNTKRQVPSIYGLDATDVSEWDNLVREPAISITESFINNEECPYKPLPLQETQTMPNSMAERYFCEVCNRVFIGIYQWNCHIKSHKHKRVLSHKKKKSS